MDIRSVALGSRGYPPLLAQIHKPPPRLYFMGANLIKLLKRPTLAIVGTRKVSPYGREATLKLAGELAGQGILIISGLAKGVDSLAHQAALESGGLTIAVLPGPLDNIVPVSNRRLADQILGQGGALVSEYPAGSPLYKQNFVARNRLMSGMAKAVLITEAGSQSGALHTAAFAQNQNRDVLVVPGPINHPGYAGSHSLIKKHANLATCREDIMDVLGLTVHQTRLWRVRGGSPQEQKLIDLLYEGVSNGEELLEQSQLSVPDFNQTLTLLEVKGKIRPLGANNWALA